MGITHKIAQCNIFQMCRECLQESNSNPRLPNKPEQIPLTLSSPALKTGKVRSAGQVLARHADSSEHTGRVNL